MACIVRGCKSHSSRKQKNSENYSFHRLPSDKSLRQLWIEAVGNGNDWVKKSRRICSRHFSADCISKEKYNQINVNAVPTLHLPPKLVDQVTTNATETDNEHINIDKGLSIVECKHCVEYKDTIKKLKKKLEKTQMISRKRVLQLKCIRERARRMYKKNSVLTSKVYELLERDKIETRSLMVLEPIKNKKIRVSIISTNTN